MCETQGTQQHEQAIRTALHYSSSRHTPWSKVASAGVSEIFMLRYPMLSTKPKANNKPWKLCHPSLHSPFHMERGWVTALPSATAGFISASSPRCSSLPTHSKGSWLSWKATWTQVPLRGSRLLMGDPPWQHQGRPWREKQVRRDEPRTSSSMVSQKCSWQAMMVNVSPLLRA